MMNDSWMSKKESPLLGLQGMGGGVGGFAFLGAAGEGGGVWGWGLNKRWFFQQRPAPQTPQSTPYRSSPVSIMGTKTDWTYVVLGQQTDTYMALDSANDLFVWGSNSYGALGQNQKEPSHPGPRALGADCQLPGTWRAMSSNNGALFAVKDTDDGLFTWGVNRHGVLGMNDVNGRSSPTRIPGTWAAAKVGGSDQHVSAIGVKTDGTLWTWGKDPKGKLGIPNGGPYPHEPETAKRYSSPIQVGTDTNWGKDRKYISSGDEWMFAIKTDGTLWSWGDNDKGVLGHNNNSRVSSPTQVGTNTNWEYVLTAGYGEAHTYAMKTDNSLWAWGSPGTAGLLGLNKGQTDGTPGSWGTISSPMQIPGSWKMEGSTGTGQRSQNWTKDDGGLFTWGSNYYGQLAQNDQGPNNPENPGPWTMRSSPIQVGSGTDWLGGACGPEGVQGAWGAKP